MINNFLNRVLDYAWDNQIGYELTDKLSPWTPSGANPLTRQIVINMNWHDKQQIPYMTAHEIAHVLHQDSGILYFCNSKNSIEGQANRMAIDILVPMYFDEIDEEFANVNSFKECFHIGEYMTDYLTDTVKKFYLK